MRALSVSKMCLLLVALMAGLLASASAVPVPERVDKCKEDCCKVGYSCCGRRCVPDKRISLLACPRTLGGCCRNPRNPCAPPPPPPPSPPVDDTPNDDSECCAEGQECCSGTCIDKLGGPNDGKAQAICFSKVGCCPPPPSTGECKADCCPEGLVCQCGGCSVFTGFPVLCAADSGTCCGDPENPCATDV